MASLIAKAGYDSGVCKVADKYQPNGYYENVKMTELLTHYLRHHDVKNKGKRFQPLRLNESWANYGSHMLTIVQNQMPTARWFFKSTKLPICWRLANRHFPYAKWLWVHRDADDIVRSMERTPFMDAYTNRQNWADMVARYYVMRDEMADTVNNFAMFDAGAIIRGNVDECQDVLDYIGSSDVDAMLLMRRTVRVDQWHCGQK